MAQGQIKKSKASAPSRRPSNPGAKKGHRVVKPKKAALVEKSKLSKKLSAGLTAKTERNLAEKAGHLEMLAGGKRDKKKAAAAGKGAGPGTQSAGTGVGAKRK